ncbi:MAG: hypothetical protein HUU21_11685 [Polyangiaceae bacterium]|nr:hypothetical protein [Polyangiaceae bacterium]
MRPASRMTPIPDPESDSASFMLADITGDGLDDVVVGDVDMTGGSEQPIPRAEERTRAGGNQKFDTVQRVDTRLHP